MSNFQRAWNALGVELEKLLTARGEDTPTKPPGTPLPTEPAPIDLFPAKTKTMFYYQHGDRPLKLWQAGETPPNDGSLHLNVANSIDDNHDKPNTPAVGIDWQPYLGLDGGDAMHFWWNHAYGRSAGARCVFSRNVWKPTGLLPYKESTLYGLIDFMTPAFPVGAGFEKAWVTWPLEIKAHDAYKQATVAANVDANLMMWWGKWWPDTRFVLNERFQMVVGKLHRMIFRMDMFSDVAKGRFQASIDGTPVVDQRGQMAFRTTEWAGCAAFIPCLYGNQLKAQTDGYIPNMILSTEPIGGIYAS